MYCQKCGQPLQDQAPYCVYCGAETGIINPPDKPWFVFAFLGFISPIIGLILYLVYDSKRPKRARSAIRGALAGIIGKIVLFIFMFVLTLVSHMANTASAKSSLAKAPEQCEISIEQFHPKNNSAYFTETKLEVPVKNKAETKSSFYITLEEVDETGAKINIGHGVCR